MKVVVGPGMSGTGDRLVGTVLDGRYLVQQPLGSGGMGSVYRGLQISVGREVAIKVVNPQWVGNRDIVRRFVREASLTSQLVHPNAVSVLDFGQTRDGVYYLVMELLHGRSLEQLLRAERRLSPERVVRIGSQICSALIAAHHLSILHRDLKPANIILLDGPASTEHVKVVDFGVAKSLSPSGGGLNHSNITEVGALLGTPAYMPPEVLFGAASDHRSDLYSLGAIMYELATGRPPYLAETVPALIGQLARNQPVPPPHELGVPVPLARVISALIARNPAHRYMDAAHVQAALAELDSGRPTSMTPLPAVFQLPPAAVQQPRPHRAWPVALAVLALCAAALMIGLLSKPAGTTPGREAPAAQRMR